jgi:hypothetical protein
MLSEGVAKISINPHLEDGGMGLVKKEGEIANKNYCLDTSITFVSAEYF